MVQTPLLVFLIYLQAGKVPGINQLKAIPDLEMIRTVRGDAVCLVVMATTEALTRRISPFDMKTSARLQRENVRF